MRPLPLKFRPGISSDPTPRDAEYRWKDSDFVRWSRGYPEKIGGWVSLLGAGGDPVEGRGVVRALHDWSDLSGQQWVAIGTNKKLYLLQRGRLFDITPTRREATVLNAFATTNDEPDVVVTDPAHSANPGDIVEITSSVSVGGLTLLGDYEIRQVIGADAYVIRASANASATTTGGGTVTLRYDISAGPEAATVRGGWGTGPYGLSTYGTRRTDSQYLVQPRIWSLQSWGEDLIASPSGGTVYWWRRSLGPTARAVVRPNAPRRILRLLVTPEERRLIALGATTQGGQDDDLFVRWSDSENFDSWAITQTNTAGSKRIDVGSRIVTGLRTRLGTLIWTDKALHVAQPIGPPLIYGFDQLGENVSIVGPNAAIDRQGLVAWMGDSNFYIYDGVVQVLPCEVWATVFEDFNRVQGYGVACVLNEPFREVTWYYPSANSDFNDRYVTFQYEDGAWYYGSLGRSAAMNRSPAFNTPYAADGGEGDSDTERWRIYLHETGVDADGAPIEAYIESWDMYLQGSDLHTHVRQLIPDFKRLEGDIDLELRVKRRPQTPTYTIKSYTAIEDDREFISVRARGQQIAIRWESSDLGDDWRLGDMELMVTPHGRR